jgi:hypothetical protein
VKLWKVSVAGACIALVMGGLVYWLAGMRSDVRVDEGQTKRVQAELAGDAAAGNLIDEVHGKMNDLVGWGHYEEFSDKNSDAWKDWAGTYAKDIKDELQKAEQEVKKDGGKTAETAVKDLDNAMALVDVATVTHDVHALLFLHRIVSDLGQFAYGHYTDHRMFGYTYTFNGPNVRQVEDMIRSVGH